MYVDVVVVKFRLRLLLQLLLMLMLFLMLKLFCCGRNNIFHKQNTQFLSQKANTKSACDLSALRDVMIVCYIRVCDTIDNGSFESSRAISANYALSGLKLASFYSLQNKAKVLCLKQLS